MVCLGKDLDEIHVLINLVIWYEKELYIQYFVISTGLLVMSQKKDRQLRLVSNQMIFVHVYNATKKLYIRYDWDKMLSISMHMVQKSTVWMYGTLSPVQHCGLSVTSQQRPSVVDCQ